MPPWRCGGCSASLRAPRRKPCSACRSMKFHVRRAVWKGARTVLLGRRPVRALRCEKVHRLGVRGGAWTVCSKNHANWRKPLGTRERGQRRRGRWADARAEVGKSTSLGLPYRPCRCRLPCRRDGVDMGGVGDVATHGRGTNLYCAWCTAHSGYGYQGGPTPLCL